MISRSENNTVQEKPSGSETPRVVIVDDDESVREAIRSLLRSVGIVVEVFASAEEFLKSDSLKDAACLILDVGMTGMSGLALQDRLVSAHSEIPIIFITAHASDKEARSRALKAGAVGFLHKPFSEEALLNDVYAVLQLPGVGLDVS
jgi:two-component system, LuxR family, response regulator FixJ